jgi:hypothetical protein
MRKNEMHKKVGIKIYRRYKMIMEKGLYIGRDASAVPP